MPPPNTMLERIAEAISVSFHEEGYIEGQSEPELWDEFMKAAREVLRTMHDLTHSIRSKEGMQTNCPMCGGYEEGWHIIIDAILNEEKS